MTVRVISISRLSSLPMIPNVKCIGWSFDGSNFIAWEDKRINLRKLRFENGNVVPNVESYFEKY
jgi:hypothetical protein